MNKLRCQVSARRGEHGLEAGSRSHFAAESRVRVRVCYLGD